MRILLLTLLLFIIGFGSKAQVPLTIGESRTIYSDTLQENRTYWIYVPPHKQGEKLPVSVVLDGDINFPLLVTTQQFLTRGRIPMTEKSIVIGILNTNRTRDLTPTHVENNKEDAMQKGGDYSQTGGADNFLYFLHKELLPALAKIYPTNNESTLIGHSFGGLTCLYSFIKHPEYFDRYVAIDPSLWWDKHWILSNLKKTLKSKKLFIGFSGSEKSDTKKLETLLKENKQNITFQYYPKENHGTVMHAGLFDYLKTLNKGEQFRNSDR